MEAPDFLVEDLLDLPNGDEIMADGFFDSSAAGISTDSSTFTPVDSCNSSASGGAADANFSSDFPCRSFADAQFSGELCVPCDDVAELEWLSNFVEESFTTEYLQRLHLGPGSTQPHRQQPFASESGLKHCSSAMLRPDGSVPGKARSKLSRVAPSDWSTRLLVGPSTSAEGPSKKMTKKRAESSDGSGNGEVRRCLHCAAEKTPQWRTGPMGPKTLCNACGVRYKSGRLVPEYRPAASPTFVATKHSNSHRKVLELRRQREHQRLHHHQFLGHGPGGAAAGVYVGAGTDFLIHHNVGPEFRQMI